MLDFVKHLFPGDDLTEPKLLLDVKEEIERTGCYSMNIGGGGRKFTQSDMPEIERIIKKLSEFQTLNN